VGRFGGRKLRINSLDQKLRNTPKVVPGLWEETVRQRIYSNRIPWRRLRIGCNTLSSMTLWCGLAFCMAPLPASAQEGHTLRTVREVNQLSNIDARLPSDSGYPVH